MGEISNNLGGLYEEEFLVVCVIGVGVINVVACAQDMSPMEEEPMEEGPEAYTEEEVMDESEEASTIGDADVDAGFSNSSVNAQEVKRIVIKNASLTITVPDPAEVISEITLMAERMGGWVVSSKSAQRYYNDADKDLTYGDITIRIPAEGLTSALSEIRGLTIDQKEDVSFQKITGQDVTSDYTDLESRLRNLEDAAESLRGFMEAAEDTESVLEVFYQLNDVNEEIELVKGKLKYYDEASAMSSIAIDVLPKYTPVEPEPPEPYVEPKWDPNGVFKNTIDSLVEFFQDFVDFLIRFVFGFIPRFLVIAAPFSAAFYLIVLIIKKRKKKSPLKPWAKEDEKQEGKKDE